MNQENVKYILQRVSRISNRINSIQGSGTSWSYKFLDGFETKYILNGIKPIEELEDDIFNMFIWLWNLKDYLKELLKNKGKDPNSIETKVNSDQRLAICADIANSLKHGKLRKSRSGLFPILGKLSYSVPHQSLGKLTFRENEVEFDFKETNSIEVKLPVSDQSGNNIGDVFELISHSTSEWESELNKIEKIV